MIPTTMIILNLIASQMPSACIPPNPTERANKKKCQRTINRCQINKEKGVNFRRRKSSSIYKQKTAYLDVVHQIDVEQNYRVNNKK